MTMHYNLKSFATENYLLGSGRGKSHTIYVSLFSIDLSIRNVRSGKMCKKELMCAG